MLRNAATNTKQRFAQALEAVQKAPTEDPKITPYVAYRGHLSQVWINRWTVLLLLVLARLLLATVDLNDGIGSAQREALSACTGVESAASAMASMPHYMAQGTNDLVAKGVENAINGLMSMILLSVTVVEELIVFIINMLTSTYVCLITLAIRGSLHVAIGLIEDVTGFLNKTLGTIGDDINNGINNFEGELNKFIGGLNDVGSFFGGSGSTVPTLDVHDSISALQNVHLPSDLNDSLDKLNASIPTFDQVQNFTNNAIRFPFEEIKKLINESLPTYTANRSMFPVPAKEQMRFCSDNNGITSFFSELIHIKNMAQKIGIAVLVVLAVAIMLPMGWREARRYRMQQQRAQLISTHATNNMDVIYIASRPYTAAAGLAAAGPVATDRRRALVRWVIAYCTTPAALFVLSLGAAGLFSALCQYILLRSLQKEVPALTHEVGQFAGKVVDTLTDASATWANGTNTAILDTNARINHDLFGWVNTSTSAVNDTLNVFVDQMTTALNETFGGTVLYDPITEVLNCLIGLKIASFQKGLTWVSDHAHIDFPLLANDTFSLGAAASLTNSTSDDSFLADPNSGTSDKITAAVNRLIDRMARQWCRSNAGCWPGWTGWRGAQRERGRKERGAGDEPGADGIAGAEEERASDSIECWRRNEDHICGLRALIISIFRACCAAVSQEFALPKTLLSASSARRPSQSPHPQPVLFRPPRSTSSPEQQPKRWPIAPGDSNYINTSSTPLRATAMMSFHPQQGMQPPGMAPGQPGMVPQPGHPMAHPGPQMHPGMHPMAGGPHISQGGAMMPGMHPNAGPNGHAISHLHPQAQMFQNPAMNPQFQPNQQMMMAQQQSLRQRQAMMQAQTQAHNGQMPMNMPGNMNPQAFQAIQQGQIRSLNLPQHLQAQYTQQPISEAQLNQQRMINMNQQRIHAQQHPPGSQGQPGTPLQAPQMRPQQSMQSMHDGSQGGQTPQQSQPPQVSQTAVSRLLMFCEKLSSFDSTLPMDAGEWQEFVDEWFSPDATFCKHLFNDETSEGKFWELPQAALGRYFWMQARHGVSKMQVCIASASQRELPIGNVVESPNLTVTYCFHNGVRLVSTGELRAIMNQQGNRFAWLEFHFNKNEEFIPSELIRRRLQPSSPHQTKSPKMTKTPAKQKKAQLEIKIATITEAELPRAPTGGSGALPEIQRFLELAEVMNHMPAIFQFAQSNPELGPYEAMERCVEASMAAAQANQQMQMNPANGVMQQFSQMQGGMRTPGLSNQGFNFASPQNQNMQLGNNMNSPMMRPGQSPAMHGSGAMAAPGSQSMVAQPSQQGSTSATASSNASPNVSNKKRRASAVKVEGDEVNGAGKNNPKATPKIGGKRQKNAGS
ncbi:hypothetical protein FH972_023116 [Carpinus fangiana]|uniref:Uncharacterized protein n=1 Tax=Carpinus fangiana TaxID=176857 RepID=A0A5N6KUJ7_9ROSI|nr:hypothetical protein FH972_023116 [Carpinus fangiana]